MPPKAAIMAAASPWLFATAVAAHHSFAAQFDGDKPVVLKGIVTKVDWRNPHIWVYLDVRDENGTMVKWECEGGAPNALTRQGWSREHLKLGEELTVEGWRAKDGTHTCNARTWRVGGQTVLAGSSNANAGGNDDAASLVGSADRAGRPGHGGARSAPRHSTGWRRRHARSPRR